MVTQHGQTQYFYNKFLSFSDIILHYITLEFNNNVISESNNIYLSTGKWEEDMPLSTNKQIYIREVIPVIDRKVRGLCKKPYYNHPKGCPNFGIKEGCPPKIGLFDEEYDMIKPVYIIFNAFDLASHVNKMRISHPEWTQRQLECSRYWQGTARKSLRQKIASFESDNPDYYVTTCPEAMGLKS